MDSIYLKGLLGGGSEFLYAKRVEWYLAQGKLYVSICCSDYSLFYCFKLIEEYRMLISIHPQLWLDAKLAWKFALSSSAELSRLNGKTRHPLISPLCSGVLKYSLILVHCNAKHRGEGGYRSLLLPLLVCLLASQK